MSRRHTLEKCAAVLARKPDEDRRLAFEVAKGLRSPGYENALQQEVERLIAPEVFQDNPPGSDEEPQESDESESPDSPRGSDPDLEQAQPPTPAQPEDPFIGQRVAKVFIVGERVRRH